MLEVRGDSPSPSDTQGKIVFGRECRKWTESELEALRAIAPRHVGRRMLLESVPGRTLKAAKKQLAKVRQDMGINRSPKTNNGVMNDGTPRTVMLAPDDPGESCDEQRKWRDKAEKSNALMLAALQAAAA